MSFNNNRMMVTTRKMRESPQEPLAPAVNLKTIPGLLMCINFCGILYFLFMTLLIVAVSFSITLPALHDGTAYWSRMSAALFILFQVQCMYPCTAGVSNLFDQRAKCTNLQEAQLLLGDRATRKHAKDS